MLDYYFDDGFSRRVYSTVNLLVEHVFSRISNRLCIAYTVSMWNPFHCFALNKKYTLVAEFLYPIQLACRTFTLIRSEINQHCSILLWRAFFFFTWTRRMTVNWRIIRKFNRGFFFYPFLRQNHITSKRVPDERILKSNVVLASSRAVDVIRLIFISISAKSVDVFFRKIFHPNVSVTMFLCFQMRDFITKARFTRLWKIVLVHSWLMEI